MKRNTHAAKQDRVSKFHVIAQELEESALWLELLADNKLFDPKELAVLLDETNQLIGIFIASIKKLQGT